MNNENNDCDELLIRWHIDDIRVICSSLNDDQCREVLGYLEHTHDCNFGINWGVIEYAIRTLFPNYECDFNY